jgi:hypothetical protein
VAISKAETVRLVSTEEVGSHISFRRMIRQALEWEESMEGTYFLSENVGYLTFGPINVCGLE